MWLDNYVIIFMWYILDLLILEITVGNCVFVCLYGLYFYFVVPISFVDWYLARKYPYVAKYAQHHLLYKAPSSCLVSAFVSSTNTPFTDNTKGIKCYLFPRKPPVTCFSWAAHAVSGIYVVLSLHRCLHPCSPHGCQIYTYLWEPIIQGHRYTLLGQHQPTYPPHKGLHFLQLSVRLIPL